jgi:hypothetical protein
LKLEHRSIFTADSLSECRHNFDLVMDAGEYLFIRRRVFLVRGLLSRLSVQRVFCSFVTDFCIYHCGIACNLYNNGGLIDSDCICRTYGPDGFGLTTSVRISSVPFGQGCGENGQKMYLSRSVCVSAILSFIYD